MTALTDRAYHHIGMCACRSPLCATCELLGDLITQAHIADQLSAELEHFQEQSIRIVELERELAERKLVESWHGKAGVAL